MSKRMLIHSLAERLIPVDMKRLRVDDTSHTCRKTLASILSVHVDLTLWIPSAAAYDWRIPVSRCYAVEGRLRLSAYVRVSIYHKHTS